MTTRQALVTALLESGRAVLLSDDTVHTAAKALIAAYYAEIPQDEEHADDILECALVLLQDASDTKLCISSETEWCTALRDDVLDIFDMAIAASLREAACIH